MSNLKTITYEIEDSLLNISKIIETMNFMLKIIKHCDEKTDRQIQIFSHREKTLEKIYEIEDELDNSDYED